MKNNKVLMICGLVLILSIPVEALFVHHHAYYWWHSFIGFDIIFGLGGAVVLLVLAKTLGKLLIQQAENFYEGGEGDE